jgi:hypothetical protein
MGLIFTYVERLILAKSADTLICSTLAIFIAITHWVIVQKLVIH